MLNVGAKLRRAAFQLGSVFSISSRNRATGNGRPASRSSAPSEIGGRGKSRYRPLFHLPLAPLVLLASSACVIGFCHWLFIWFPSAFMFLPKSLPISMSARVSWSAEKSQATNCKPEGQGRYRPVFHLLFSFISFPLCSLAFTIGCSLVSVGVYINARQRWGRQTRNIGSERDRIPVQITAHTCVQILSARVSCSAEERQG